MTTPSSRLLDALIPGAVLMLRSSKGDAIGDIAYAEALRYARRGEIEGVGPRSGVIRFLRMKPESAIEINVAEHARHEEVEARKKPHQLNAQTELGAYRQHLSVGSVWALCLCRSAGI